MGRVPHPDRVSSPWPSGAPAGTIGVERNGQAGLSHPPKRAASFRPPARKAGAPRSPRAAGGGRETAGKEERRRSSIRLRNPFRSLLGFFTQFGLPILSS